MNTIYDYSKLLGRIKEKYGTRENLIQVITISATSLNLRLNNKLKFNQQDIKELSEALDIQEKEIPDYFFKEKVRKS
jgi:predicted transcriptional regulator